MNEFKLLIFMRTNSDGVCSFERIQTAYVHVNEFRLLMFMRTNSDSVCSFERVQTAYFHENEFRLCVVHFERMPTTREKERKETTEAPILQLSK